MTEHLGNAKVSELDHFGGCQKHIGAFDVAMQDFSIVHMLEREAKLHKEVQNLIFRQIIRRTPSLSGSNERVEVSAIGIFGHNAQFIPSGHETLFVPDNVGMIQCSEHFALSSRDHSILFGDSDALEHIMLARFINTPDKHGLSVATFTDGSDRAILFHQNEKPTII